MTSFSPGKQPFESLVARCGSTNMYTYILSAMVLLRQQACKTVHKNWLVWPFLLMCVACLAFDPHRIHSTPAGRHVEEEESVSLEGVGVRRVNEKFSTIAKPQISMCDTREMWLV